jgi:hypothetical protein
MHRAAQRRREKQYGADALYNPNAILASPGTTSSSSSKTLKTPSPMSAATSKRGNFSSKNSNQLNDVLLSLGSAKLVSDEPSLLVNFHVPIAPSPCEAELNEERANLRRHEQSLQARARLAASRSAMQQQHAQDDSDDEDNDDDNDEKGKDLVENEISMVDDPQDKEEEKEEEEEEEEEKEDADDEEEEEERDNSESENNDSDNDDDEFDRNVVHRRMNEARLFAPHHLHVRHSATSFVSQLPSALEVAMGRNFDDDEEEERKKLEMRQQALLAEIEATEQRARKRKLREAIRAETLADQASTPIRYYTRECPVCREVVSRVGADFWQHMARSHPHVYDAYARNLPFDDVRQLAVDEQIAFDETPLAIAQRHAAERTRRQRDTMQLVFDPNAVERNDAENADAASTASRIERLSAISDHCARLVDSLGVPSDSMIQALEASSSSSSSSSSSPFYRVERIDDERSTRTLVENSRSRFVAL